ncbi:hypothetical protein LTR70_007802 [Exophiala xenobiotica]|uniref:Cytochrome P450 n=1 Tax=Lithohypha guttulata TaxID=1690604 RepID=A0ABR0K0Y4_9EURO|nr:hypothetical protein LTR24_008624 [Lithohypha guttulata]KAK5313110.1 hypothetical protein LTR70_007802 [Exophiala xenobiotica]
MELGCQDAPVFPGGGILGLNNIRRMQEADKKKLFPDHMIEREQTMSRIHGRECSTFYSDLLGQKVYFTSDPQNIKAMLATQFEDFYFGPARRGNMIQTLGDGIFVQDGKQWEHSRALLRPNFVRDQISDLELEEHHVQNLLKAIGPMQPDGWTAETEIQTLFFRLTIDSATEFVFGESVESQINGIPGAASQKSGRESSFAHHFDSAQMHMARRFRLGDMYWTHNPREYRENNKVVNDFVAHYVDIALRGTRSDTKMEEGTRKGRYVFLEAVAQQTRDPYELRSQLLNILLAGRDTTASLLSWLFHQLLRNPEAFTKLRSSVIETFGTYEDPRDVTFASLKGCQYLQYCLNETLRLWTVVPGNGRRSKKATTLPRGGGPDGKSPIYLPPDTEVNYSIHVMHRRKDIWGADAEEFKPERFIGRRSGWEYLPFNGGPRICIGQQFALTEASYVVVRLLQRFDQIEAGAHELEDRITSNLTLTNCPGKPVTLRLHAARE